MTDAELIAQLETRLRYHETEAERCRRMLAIAREDGALVPRTTGARRGGEPRNPPRAGGRRRLGADLVAQAHQLRKDGKKLKEIGAALHVSLPSVSRLLARRP